MKKLLMSGVRFVRENPRILYSLVLLVFVPAAFFFNTYTILQSMEKDIDVITQRKAVLAENVINTFVADKVADRSSLQEIINRIMQGNEDILSLAILIPEENSSRFRIIASSEPEALDQTTENLQYVLAWSRPEGIAFLDQDRGERFWRVTKQLGKDPNDKTGLVTLTLPLKDTDVLINKTVNRSYWILIGTILVVLLLVSNQARLFGYVLAVNKMKEIDAMKDTFIAMASHDLKSPLTAMKGYLELLEEKKLALDEEARGYFHNIGASIDRLSVLVGDMLEVSKLEGNRIPFTFSTVSPITLVRDCIEELRPQAMAKGLTLNWLPAPESADIRVSVDPDRLKQIVANLLSNAIKYTPQGKVDVSMTTKGKECLITFADTGIGISDEDKQNLFRKFSRIQNEKTKSIAGTGLGLWITLELAKRMGGTITVESIQGIGSHFTLHLPLINTQAPSV